MPLWKNYVRSKSIHESLDILNRAGTSTRIIAGGTDLLLDLQQGRQPTVDTLVDVSLVPELNRIEIRGDDLFLGAAVSLNRIVDSSLVLKNVEALNEACGLIGGPQVRNIATLGGNVAHALPAADGSIALLAMDARAEVVNLRGSRQFSIGDLYLGPGKSALQPGDLLVGFYLPLRQPGQASGFQRVMRPQGVALPIINMATWMWRVDDRIQDIRVALGPSGLIPFRAKDVENLLRGQPLFAGIIQQACTALTQEANFRTSPHRATADYRRHLAISLLKTLLDIVWERTM
jgi:carbon-monoxide dehydrogenase medium subunit